MAADIEVYGTDWCSSTFGVREYLTQSGLRYQYFNIEQDSSAHEFVLAMNDGRRRFPMVTIEQRVITNPTLTELQRIVDAYQARVREGRRTWR
jgi:mycoredoxin